MSGINSQCIGCGTCAAVAPDLFKVEGIPAQIIKKLAPTDAKSYKEAQSACPVQAIEDF
ncbi:MAG: ferredoxin [candidate division SR1 bacterium]|nr:ferredoxin [candidate division SR1 bacterium]